ncbi:Uncharacterised protein [uncultured archaeon]|nr:Uncharacterised protein [uncultured archaeon]
MAEHCEAESTRKLVKLARSNRLQALGEQFSPMDMVHADCSNGDLCCMKGGEINIPCCAIKLPGAVNHLF